MNHLMAGTGRCDITPAPGTPQGGWGAQTHQRGSGADMPLRVTALVISDSQQRCAIIDVDNCGFETPWILQTIQVVSDLTGIPPDNIRLSYSHTHSGPNNYRMAVISEGRDMILSYMEDIPRRIAGAVWQAERALRPVRYAAGTGVCKINVNRRDKTPEGWAVGRNTTAPVDHTVRVVRFDDLNESPVATIVHYACHPTTIAWQNQLFTPDYPGVVRKVVEEQIGGTCLFLQGAAGNIGPKYGFTGDLKVYRRLGTMLGLEASSVAASLETLPRRQQFIRLQASGAPIAIYEDLPSESGLPILGVNSCTIKMPLRPGPSLDEVQNEVRESVEALNRLRQRKISEEDIRLATARAVQAEDKLAMVREYEGKTHIDWRMMGIRIGDIALLSVPGEPLTEVNHSIVAKSPFPHTLFSGYSNGGFGYLPTAELYKEGGYEVEASPFSPSASELVVTEGLEMLRRLWAAN
ncbi:MAG: neutral/alkaline non-lysosomal ceramidase N-terminal domain-containing protein [Acidobacteriaceae bacterium]